MNLTNLTSLWRRSPAELPESWDQVPAFWLAIPFHTEGPDQVRRAGQEGIKLWIEFRGLCERKYFPDERFDAIAANEAGGELTEEDLEYRAAYLNAIDEYIGRKMTFAFVHTGDWYSLSAPQRGVYVEVAEEFPQSRVEGWGRTELEITPAIDHLILLTHFRIAILRPGKVLAHPDRTLVDILTGDGKVPRKL